MENKGLKQSKKTPNNKNKYTTKFGRFLDSISYISLVKITALIWEISVFYFWFATYFSSKHGLKIETLGCKIEAGNPICDKFDLLFSSLYFSGVTITTLGYGDILPLGFGRLVAVLLAVGGLTIIAVLISKVSSERESSMLLLLHTSDVERRISGFRASMSEYIDEIKPFSYEKEIKKYEKDLKMSRFKGTRVRLKTNQLPNTLKKLRILLKISNQYITFHSNQSLSLERGADTAVAQYINKLSEVQACILNLKHFAQQHRNIEISCVNISKDICSIEDALLNNIKEKQLDGLLESNSLVGKHQAFEEWLKSNYTESWVHKVKQELPSVPRANWPLHEFKKIAIRLDVSNVIVKICIKELIRRGEC